MPRLASVAAALAFVGACAVRPHVGTLPDAGCISGFKPDTDYFPDKSTVTDATNLTISYHHSYQVLTVKRPYPNASAESYVLVRCGAPAPQLQYSAATPCISMRQTGCS